MSLYNIAHIKSIHIYMYILLLLLLLLLFLFLLLYNNYYYIIIYISLYVCVYIYQHLALKTGEQLAAFQSVKKTVLGVEESEDASLLPA